MAAGVEKIASRDRQRLEQGVLGALPETSETHNRTVQLGGAAALPASHVESPVSCDRVADNEADEERIKGAFNSALGDIHLETPPDGSSLQEPSDHSEATMSQRQPSSATATASQTRPSHTLIPPQHALTLGQPLDLVVQSRETDDNDLFADDEYMTTPAVEDILPDSTQPQDSLGFNDEEDPVLIRHLTPESTSFGEHSLLVSRCRRADH